MKGSFWTLGNLWFLLRMAIQAVKATQALGNYLKAGGSEKKEVAMGVLESLIHANIRHFKLPVPPVGIEALRPILGILIEVALMVSKRKHAADWKPPVTNPLTPSPEQARLVIQSVGNPSPAIKTKADYLQMAVDEFAALERRNAAKRAAKE